MARKICLFISIFCLSIAVAGCKTSSQENRESIDSLYSSIKETQSSFEEESSSTDSNATSEEMVTDKEEQGFVYMTEGSSSVIVRYVGQVLDETFTIPDTLDGGRLRKFATMRLLLFMQKKSLNCSFLVRLGIQRLICLMRFPIWKKFTFMAVLPSI